MNAEKTSINAVKFIVFFILSIVSGQGVTPSGDPYFCVPPGICASSGGIDPRIVTPADAEDADIERLIQEVFFNRIITDGTPVPGPVSCPSGRVPCFAQGTDSNCGRSTNTFVDGNAPAGSHPWLAFLMNSTGSFLGGGSLLSPYHVLTAAHKVAPYVNTPNQLTVVMGVNNPATMPPAAYRSVASRISIFSTSTLTYDAATLKNDLAIIRLANPISLTSSTLVNTICLPPAGANYASPPQRCIVAGWGQIQPNNTVVPTILKQVNVNTTDINTCENGFSGIVNTGLYLDKTGGQLCAGGEAQKDACFQDGGGPLTCGLGTAASRFTVTGIVIWGKSCGQPGVYGVYTNVPYATYRTWIISSITEAIP
ncbi:hypothetical protein WA026_005592 [Henosepilachna vigintioctopunctata]|uniref:Peptidase S1 domain-containing protein n=1 Tax=Henosepilachna vigintioctopunctata TaxID=420089 RepID=A0AAW1U4F7_9CUCU